MVKLTIKEIANKINISAGTIDRVLKNRGGVSKQTELLVQKALVDYNYEPNYIGVALSRAKKVFHVVICVDFLSPDIGTSANGSSRSPAYIDAAVHAGTNASSSPQASSYSGTDIATVAVSSSNSSSAAADFLDGVSSAAKAFSCYSIAPIVVYPDKGSPNTLPNCPQSVQKGDDSVSKAVTFSLIPHLTSLGETAGNIILLINKNAKVAITYNNLNNELHIINGFLKAVNKTPITILSQDFTATQHSLMTAQPEPIMSADIVMTVTDSSISCNCGASTFTVSADLHELGYCLMKDIVNFAFCGVPLPSPSQNLTVAFTNKP